MERSHCEVLRVDWNGPGLWLLGLLLPSQPPLARSGHCLKQRLDPAGGQVKGRILFRETPALPNSACGKGRKESGKRESGVTSGFGAGAAEFLGDSRNQNGDR